MAIIDKPSDYFNTVLYTGNGSTQSITGVGFQPDWSWFKVRSEVGSHRLVDAVRGNTKYLYSNASDAEETVATNVTSFDSDGYTLGNESINESARTYASWNWKAGTAFSNSAGENGADLASDGSYNRDAGFSIVTFTGNATDDQQIYHGLNAVPQMMILKNRTNANAENWQVYHQAIGNTHALSLNTTAAKNDNDEFWSDETPTSTVFTVGRQDATNGNGNTHVVYCFAEKQGYSKFGSYTGNGSTDGTFVYTGFKPAFVMTKRTDTTSNWHMYDSKRDVDNGVTFELRANTNDAETDVFDVIAEYRADFLSNGFKVKTTQSSMNASGGSYIYMAFAENPFVTSTGVPATAR
jgi:hypothetical protein